MGFKYSFINIKMANDLYKDILTYTILKMIADSKEPFETKEIEQTIKKEITEESITRAKIFYRLNLLRGESKIKGKFVGPGKGVWIWWRNPNKKL